MSRNIVILAYKQEKLGVAFTDVIDVREEKYSKTDVIKVVNSFMGTKLTAGHFQKAVSLVERYFPGEVAREEGILGVTVTRV